MSRRKTERLLGLVVCLLSSPRYLTAVQIRAAVPGYPESFEAFKRMFERDKEELRELGIPLETGFNSAGEDEAGYRIPRQAYVLPEIRLEPDEAAVLSLAARVWRQAELAGAAAGALLKLRAAGVDAEETAETGIEPRLLAGEAAFGPLWEAVRDRRPVTFAYRAAGGANRSSATSSRGGWSTGMAAGTWPGMTATGTRPACSGSAVSRATCGSAGPPGRWPCRRAPTCGRPSASGTPSRRRSSGPRSCGCARERGSGSAGTPPRSPAGTVTGSTGPSSTGAGGTGTGPRPAGTRSVSRSPT